LRRENAATAHHQSPPLATEALACSRGENLRHLAWDFNACAVARARALLDERDKQRKKTYTLAAGITQRYAQANSGGQA
jgi:hypothetical protein